MRAFLIGLMLAVLAAMLYVTISASLEQSLWPAVGELWPNGWFRATLADAYFGFLMVYLWISYRERTHFARGAWLVLLVLLGNIAIAIYVILALLALPPGADVGALFKRKEKA